MAATKTLFRVFALYGPKCYTDEAKVNSFYLESTKVVIFFYKDIEVINPDHRRPLF